MLKTMRIRMVEKEIKHIRLTLLLSTSRKLQSLKSLKKSQG
jgi:hypothetical protein